MSGPRPDPPDSRTREAGPVGDQERQVMVLDPAFVQDLGALSLSEVRERRDQALAQREYLSYLRRLLQVRLDLLTAQSERRGAGGGGAGGAPPGRERRGRGGPNRPSRSRRRRGRRARLGRPRDARARRP